jgi:hypothetical protein
VGATVGGAFFQHLFRRTGEQFRELSSGPVPVRTASPEAEFDPFDPGGEHTRMMARIAPPDPAESVTVYQGRRRLRPRNWKVLALSSVLVFAVAMGTVTAAELVAGKPMADVVRNTSGSGTTFGGGSSSTRQQVSTTPTTPTAAPGDGASHASGGEQQNSSSGAVTSPGSGPSPTGASTSPGPTPATGTPSPSASAGTQSPQARPTPSATPSP